MIKKISLMVLFYTIVFAQSSPEKNRWRTYFFEKDFSYVVEEVSFQAQACSLLSVKPPTSSSALLDFVKKYDLNFGYSCCISTMPDSFVLYNPLWIFNLCCADSLKAHGIVDSMRAYLSKLTNYNGIESYYSQIEKFFFDAAMSYPYNELKERALEKIIHAAVANELFSKISDTSLLKDCIDEHALQKGTVFNLDMGLNDLLLSDSVYKETIFKAYIQGIHLTRSDSLLNMMFYIDHLTKDSSWLENASKITFWKFLLSPYRKILDKTAFLEFCNRIFLYDSLSETELGFLVHGSKNLLSQSFAEKYALKVQEVLDNYTTVLVQDTLKIILFDSTEAKVVSAGLLKLSAIYNQKDSLLEHSIDAFQKCFQDRVCDTVKICSVNSLADPWVFTSQETSIYGGSTLPVRQYGICGEIRSLEVNGSTVYAGTNSGLVVIDKSSQMQKLFTPLNSLLKSHSINGLNYQNGLLHIASECKEITTFDGKEWRSNPYDDTTVAYCDGIDNIAVTSNGITCVIYDNYTVAVISKSDTTFIDYEQYPFFRQAPSELMVDKKENIWFIAGNSLLCYNQKEWIRFDSSNTNFSGEELRGLCCDSSGAVWTSCKNQLYHYDGSRWDSLYIPSHPLAYGTIRHLAFDRSGILWIALFDRLLSFNFLTWKLYPSIKVSSIWDMTVDNDGDVWLGTGEGLLVLNEDTCHMVELGNAPLPGSLSCGVVVDRLGHQWVGGHEGFSVRQDGVWKKVTTKNGIDKLLCDNTGRIVAGSQEGYVYVLSDSGITTLYHPDYSERLHRIAVDSSKKIWAAFDYHIAIISDSIDTMKVMRVNDKVIHSLLVSRTGDVWATVECWNDQGNALLFRNGKWTSFDKKNSKIEGEYVTALFEDAKGGIWFSSGSSSSEDLLRFDGKRWKKYDLWHLLGIYSRSINSVCEDRDGNLWVGTEKGLASWDGRKWWIYPVKEGLWSEGISTVIIDTKDTMWVRSGTSVMAVARKDLAQYCKAPKSLKKQDNDPDSWYLHAQFTSNPDSVLYYINKAIKLNNKEGSYYVRRAETYHFLRKYSKAITDMERAVALGDTSLPGKALLGEIYFSIGNYENAWKYSSEAITTDTTYIRPYVVRSLILYNRGQNDSALKDFSRILAKEPKEYPDIYASKAEILSDRSQYDSASICINKALALDTANARTHYIHGMIHLNQKQYEEAVKAFGKALMLSPKDTGLIQNRGYSFLMLGVYDSAFKDFDAVIRLGNHSSDAFCNRGVAHFRLGAYKEAERDLKHAYKIKADNVAVCVNYISLLLELNRYDDIVPFYNSIPIQVQQNPAIVSGMGLAFIHMKDYTAALKFLNAAIKAAPTEWAAYYNIACIHARQENSILAIEWLGKAFEKGFRDFDYLEKDNDFDRLRNVKEFIELIEQYRK
jgi:tetratricopeptide (TPR) repeat protein